MHPAPQILCIGSVLWDIIGRAPSHMERGSDVPGRIVRLPGGVAMNIAMALRGFGVDTAVLTAVGSDPEGDELVTAARQRGIRTDWIYRSEDLPTDRYLAIEGKNGLIAAIADAHSLEAAGTKILRALSDGRLASERAPWGGLVALDGNLSVGVLSEIAEGALLRAADLRIAPASPGKADRLSVLAGRAGTTAYVNLEEASVLCHARFSSAAEAARAMVVRGFARVLVTHGAEDVAEADAKDVLTAPPPAVMVTRVTGAGDVFMAAHIAAEIAGEDRQAALGSALRAAADYISGARAL